MPFPSLKRWISGDVAPEPDPNEPLSYTGIQKIETNSGGWSTTFLLFAPRRSHSFHGGVITGYRALPDGGKTNEQVVVPLDIIIRQVAMGKRESDHTLHECPDWDLPGEMR